MSIILFACCIVFFFPVLRPVRFTLSFFILFFFFSPGCLRSLSRSSCRTVLSSNSRRNVGERFPSGRAASTKTIAAREEFPKRVSKLNANLKVCSPCVPVSLCPACVGKCSALQCREVFCTTV